MSASSINCNRASSINIFSCCSVSILNLYSNRFFSNSWLSSSLAPFPPFNALLTRFSSASRFRCISFTRFLASLAHCFLLFITADFCVSNSLSKSFTACLATTNASFAYAAISSSFFSNRSILSLKKPNISSSSSRCSRSIFSKRFLSFSNTPANARSAASRLASSLLRFFVSSSCISSSIASSFLLRSVSVLFAFFNRSRNVLISFFIFILLASSAVRVRRSVIAALFNSSFEEMLFSFQDKSRSVLVSDDASATTLLLILIRDDDDDDEFKFVRGLNIFSQPFFAATTTTREQQKRGVVLIIDFSDEEETEEEEIMLLFMMMMPCALYRYIHRERKSAKLFFPLERSKSRSRALRNGERCATLSFLLVCLSESE